MDYPYRDFHSSIDRVTVCNRAFGEYHCNRFYCQSVAYHIGNDLRPCVGADRRGHVASYGKVFGYRAAMDADSLYCGGKRCACTALAFHRQSPPWREKIHRLYCRANCRRTRKVFSAVCRDRANRPAFVFRLTGAASGGYIPYVFYPSTCHRLNRRRVGDACVSEIAKGYRRGGKGKTGAALKRDETGISPL